MAEPNNEPIVLVISTDATFEPHKLIEMIRKQPNTQDKVILTEGPGLIGLPYQIRTKYYTTTILLCPYGSTDLNTFPSALLKRLDGLLIYFNAKDRSFLDRIPAYGLFVEKNAIEFGMMLCHTLEENSADGITFSEARKVCPRLDVIELEPNTEDGANGVADGQEVGVDELIQAMHFQVWSNVRGPITRPRQPVSTTVGGPSVVHPHVPDLHGPVTEEEERMIEAQLTGFERMITEVMTFQPNTAGWSRHEQLMYAEELAEMFDSLLEEDDSIEMA